MSISKYVEGLLPTFDSERVQDNLTNIQLEINEFTLESAQAVAGLFPGTWEWHDKKLESLDKDIIRTYRGKVKLRNSNSFEVIVYVLENLLQTLPVMRNEAIRLFGTEVVTEGITYNKATILQYTEAVEWFIKYTRIYLNYATAKELSMLSTSRKVAAIGPDDEEYLIANRFAYAEVLNVLSVEPKEVKNALANIPKTIIDPKTEADVKVVVGNGRMDPFGFAVLPFPLSFIYRVGLSFSQWQLSRYDAAQEEANVQQYRMIVLRQLIETGKGDAAVEKQLLDAEDRYLLARKKIEKMEGDYDIPKQS